MHIVEAWGTGLPRIINRCEEYGLPEPLFEEFGDGFKATIFRKPSQPRSAEEKLLVHNEQENEQVIRNLIVEFCKEPRTTGEILEHFKMGRSYFKRHFQDKMLENGTLKRTDPDNVKNRNQKYYS